MRTGFDSQNSHIKNGCGTHTCTPSTGEAGTGGFWVHWPTSLASSQSPREQWEALSQQTGLTVPEEPQLRLTFGLHITHEHIHMHICTYTCTYLCQKRQDQIHTVSGDHPKTARSHTGKNERMLSRKGNRKINGKLTDTANLGYPTNRRVEPFIIIRIFFPHYRTKLSQSPNIHPKVISPTIHLLPCSVEGPENRLARKCSEAHGLKIHAG